MLARANRVVRAQDFRAAVRQGRRVGTAHTVVHVRDRASDEPSRFGFIIAKNVGNAVKRNLVRRRMRAASFELLSSVGGGRDIVIRALPGCDQISWTTLQREISEGIDRGVNRP